MKERRIQMKVAFKSCGVSNNRLEYQVVSDPLLLHQIKKVKISLVTEFHIFFNLYRGRFRNLPYQTVKIKLVFFLIHGYYANSRAFIVY